ncbi:CXXC-20-CXXC protein [Natronobacillus azotifigens]|uniref:TIGR04104 family putative zinc finger protein n=1 Tax=Natronobacillus azotifigens TaxID=472978 RepID=UPI003AF0D763
MATCQSCKKDWSWFQVFKKSFTVNPAVTCPHCLQRQYPTRKTIKRNQFLLCIIFSPFLLGILNIISAATVFTAIIVLGIIGILFSPFYMEITNEPLLKEKDLLK